MTQSQLPLLISANFLQALLACVGVFPFSLRLSLPSIYRTKEGYSITLSQWLAIRSMQIPTYGLVIICISREPISCQLDRYWSSRFIFSSVPPPPDPKKNYVCSISLSLSLPSSAPPPLPFTAASLSFLPTEPPPKIALAWKQYGRKAVCRMEVLHGSHARWKNTQPAGFPPTERGQNSCLLEGGRNRNSKGQKGICRTSRHACHFLSHTCNNWPEGGGERYTLTCSCAFNSRWQDIHKQRIVDSTTIAYRCQLLKTPESVIFKKGEMLRKSHLCALFRGSQYLTPPFHTCLQMSGQTNANSTLPFMLQRVKKGEALKEGLPLLLGWAWKVLCSDFKNASNIFLIQISRWDLEFWISWVLFSKWDRYFRNLP